jgi:hypothetical protein
MVEAVPNLVHGLGGIHLHAVLSGRNMTE